MKRLVKITLHGHLGEAIGQTFELAVKSVDEAIRAIEVLSGRKLYKYLLEKEKGQAKYGVLINGRDFIAEKPIETIQDIKNTELVMKKNDLETIDIVPILEGAGGKFANILAVVLGVILIVVGLVLIFGLGWTGAGAVFGWGLIMAGVGLTASGVIGLLTQPPKADPFRDFGGNERGSYLFNGPENIVGEGGPVFVGYGRLLVGSHVIAVSYDINDKDLPAVVKGSDITV